MHEIRKNRLYNEENPISKEELDILCFEDDFWRVYDILYDNSELEDIVEYSSKVDFMSIWESILENPKNKDFFKKLYAKEYYDWETVEESNSFFNNCLERLFYKGFSPETIK